MLTQEDYDAFLKDKENRKSIEFSDKGFDSLSVYEASRYMGERTPYDEDWKELKAFANGIKGSLRGALHGLGMLYDNNVQWNEENLKNLSEESRARLQNTFGYDVTKDNKNVFPELANAEILKDTEVASTSGIGQLGLDVAQGAGQLATQAAAAMLTGGYGAAAFMGLQIAGDEYQELRGQGVDVDTATKASLANAGIQAPLEYIGLGKLMKRFPANTLLKQKAKIWLEKAFTEGLTETLQQYPESISKLWAENESKYKDLPEEERKAKTLEDIKANFGEMTKEGLYSGLIGAILGGTAGGFQIALSKNVETALQKEVHATRIEQIQEQARKVKERGLEPEGVAVLINSGNPDTYHVDGEAVMAFAQSVGMKNAVEILGVTEETITQAAENGDTIDILQGNYEAATAKYDSFLQTVANDTAFEEGGFTPNDEIRLKQEVAEHQRKEEELRTEQDATLSSLLKANVPKEQANGVMTLITSFATMMNPDNPAQWMRDNALRFVRDGKFAPEIVTPEVAASEVSALEIVTPEAVVPEDSTPEAVSSKGDTEVKDKGAPFWGRKIDPDRMANDDNLQGQVGSFLEKMIGILDGDTPENANAMRSFVPDDIKEAYLEATQNGDYEKAKQILSDKVQQMKADGIYHQAAAPKNSNIFDLLPDDKRNEYVKAGKDLADKLSELKEKEKNGTFKPGNFVTVCKTPDVFTACGITDKEIVISEATLLGISKGKENPISAHTPHKVYRDILKQIPEKLCDPIIIMDNVGGNGKDNSLVAWLDIDMEDDDGSPAKAFVAISFDKWASDRRIAHIIKTIHPRREDRISSNLLKAALNGKRVYYTCANIKALVGMTVRRQLPEASDRTSALIRNKIAQKYNNVNSDNGTVQYNQTAWHGSPSDAEYNRLVQQHENGSESEKAEALNKLTEMVQKAATDAGFNDAIPEQTRAFTVRTKAAPKKTKKVYKVFTVDEQGRPSALFVSSTDTLPQNVWLDANDTFAFTDNKNGNKYIPSTKNPNTKGGTTGAAHKTADISAEDLAQLEKLGYIKKNPKTGAYPKTITGLAYRPGWHAGDLPFFPQGGKQSDGSTNYPNIHRYNQVVFECEIAYDVDYTKSHTTKDGQIKYEDRQEMPVDGGYRFATNPLTNAQDLGSWYISGSLKIGRALTEEECNKILAENGYKPQEWQEHGTGNDFVIGKLDLQKLGYTGEQHDAARKTLAPITYDDNGKVIPLSERFNSGIDDVRYQTGSDIAKGSFNPTRHNGDYIITLFQGADASTVIHETWHYFVETMWEAVQNGQATEQMQKDFDTLLEYAGTTREEWESGDVNARREAHEKLAEAGETYIMEGKAPSRELRKIFRKFANWLKAVYQTIRRNGNSIPLTDDVREVFDRMLAADEAIEEQAKINKYFDQLPKVVTDNMSDKTREKVEDFIAKAKDKAVDLITKESLVNFNADRKEEKEAYRAEILPEVEKEVAERRVYKSGVSKRNAEKYRSLFFKEDNLTDAEEMFVMETDLAAEALGYSSTDEMLKDIENSPTQKRAVTEEVNRRLKEKFPDIKDERRAYEEAVRESIYNDDTGLLIGVEQQIIEEYARKAKAGQLEADAVAGVKSDIARVEMKPKEEMRAKAAAYRQRAKEIAVNDIGQMTIGDAVRVMKYVTAERKAAMKCVGYLNDKDYENALTQKNLQAYYHAMVQESMKVKREVERNKKYLRRQRNLKRESWVSEAHYAEVSRLFERMGLARSNHDPMTGRVGSSLREYYEEMNAKYDCVDIAEWLLDTPDTEMLNDFRAMTLEQYKDIVNAVRNIRATAKAAKGAGMFGKAESFAEIKSQILKNLDKLPVRFTPNPNKPGRVTLMEEFTASLENTDNFFDRMDNWTHGFFTETFYGRIKHAMDLEYDFREKYDEAVINANKKWLPDKEAEKLASTEVYYEELKTSVTRHTLVKLLINLGTRNNAKRLCETPPVGFERSSIWVLPTEENGLKREQAASITESNLIAFLEKVLTKKDVAYAQDIINSTEMFWAEKDALERRTKGFGLNKEEATPRILHLADGEAVLKGGYFPLMRNGEMGSHPATEISDDEPLQGKNVRTFHTNTSTSKSRIAGARYPVNLFPNAETKVMYDSIHDVCFREVMNDFRRVLNDEEMVGALKTHLGLARMTVFREMLEKVAQPNRTESMSMFEKSLGEQLSFIRSKTANAIIMLNIKVNLQNLGNIFLYGNAVEGFDYKDVTAALGNYALNFNKGTSYKEMTDFISSKSPFMRERMTIPDITVRDIMEDKSRQPSEFEKRVASIGAKMMAYTDGLTAKPVWMQAYMKKINSGATEQEAVDFADAVVRRTLGSTRVADVSSLQRGGPLAKFFTMFQGFFNTQYNQWVREYNIEQKLWSEDKKKEVFDRAVAFALSKYLLVCISSLALALENPFGSDDDDGYMNLTKEMKNYPLSMLGPIGQVGSSFVGKILGMKEFGYRMSVIQSTIEKGLRAGGTFHDVITGKKDLVEGAELATDIAGLAYGVPAQVNRLLWNIYDMMVNDMDFHLEDITHRRPSKERKPD